MSNLLDYAFLFHNMPGVQTTNVMGSFRLSQLNSSSVQTQLRAAGINTNSKQYKAAIKEISRGTNGMMYANVQGIKNVMKGYDKDGDFINPTNGLAGLLVTEENAQSRKRIISIPESSRDEIFETAKNDFIKGNGMLDGDTTKRSDAYQNLYRRTQKKDRLAAGYTLQQYEHSYHHALLAAAKAADPTWECGKPIKAGALDGITRETVESYLRKSGNSLVQTSVDAKI